MSDNDAYVVGYGRPPINTQWKPGESGNKKGRPKKDNNFLSLATDIILLPVKVIGVDGRSTNMNILEASYISICKKALKGDNRQLHYIVKHMIEVLPKGDNKEHIKVKRGNEARKKLRKAVGLPEEE